MKLKAMLITGLVAGNLFAGAAEPTIAASAQPSSAPASSPCALKLLTIGNSFSVSLTKELPKVARSMGFTLDYCSLFIGGCSLQRHMVNANGKGDGKYKPTKYEISRWIDGKKVRDGKIELKEAIALEKWDIVTLQQASGESWKSESYHPAGDDLVKVVRELAPQSEIVVQETWSYTPWDKRLKEWGFDQNAMYDKLHSAYLAFAAPYGFRIIPMGTAVQNWRKTLPVKYAENSFGGDLCGGRHLKPGKMFVQKDGVWMPAPGESQKTRRRHAGALPRHRIRGAGTDRVRRSGGEVRS